MKKLLFAVLCLALCAQPVTAAELVVSAAASLTDAFKDIEPGFEAKHPGVDVVFNFAASGPLFQQIEQGAPVDVFASADLKWMGKAVDAGFVAKDAPKVFAANDLVLCAPKGNRVGVKALDDLKGEAVKTIGIGTPETVPAGAYAKKAMTKAGMFDALSPKFIFAESVRQVLDYLARGEVDAGFVYKTDAVKAGDPVEIVAVVPLDDPVVYPLAALAKSANAETAKAFVDYVLGAEGQALLAKRGFTPAAK